MKPLLRSATASLSAVIVSAVAGFAAGADFVAIKGGTLRAGILLDDFEIAAHPVTNAEYRQFIDASAERIRREGADMFEGLG